jgi:uncharacterized protein YcfL
MPRLLQLIVALLWLAGCSSSTPLSVENRSGVLLQSVLVSGSGFSHALGNLAPGATLKAEIRPSGESSIAISFLASDQQIALPPDGYFEAGGAYSVSIVITPSLTATVNSRLQSY